MKEDIRTYLLDNDWSYDTDTDNYFIYSYQNGRKRILADKNGTNLILRCHDNVNGYPIDDEVMIGSLSELRFFLEDYYVTPIDSDEMDTELQSYCCRLLNDFDVEKDKGFTEFEGIWKIDNYSRCYDNCELLVEPIGIKDCIRLLFQYDESTIAYYEDEYLGTLTLKMKNGATDIEIFSLEQLNRILMFYGIRFIMDNNGNMRCEHIRTIKFRGVSLSDNVFSYGYMTEKDGSYFVGDVSVNPFTIGQFIGMCDRNGKEIYEGDIISINEGNYKLVKFDEDSWSFCLANISDLDYADIMDVWQVPNKDWWNRHKDSIEVTSNLYKIQ